MESRFFMKVLSTSRKKVTTRGEKVETGFSDSGSTYGFLLGYMWLYALKYHQNTLKKIVLNEWSSV